MAGRRSRRDAELEGRIDGLYRLPLAEFTAARNALAAELKKGGDAQASERIRNLTKPVATAWIVNRLYCDERQEFEELLATGIRLRALQGRGMGDAETLRDVMDGKREAILALRQRAEKLAGDGGMPLSRGALRRVEANLDAVATYGGAGPDQQLGRMVADLEPPGFEAVLGLGAARKQRPARAKKTRKKKTPSPADLRKLERARAAHDKARKEVQRRQSASRSADDRLRQTKERLEETREMVRAAERGLRLLRNKDRRAERDLANATSRVENAREALFRARDGLRAAAAALKKTSESVLN